MDSRAVRTFRVFVLASASVAIVLGVVAIVWPRPSLVAVALVVGVYLVVGGALRVVAAVRAHGAPSSWRWLSGVVGAVVGAAGLVSLVDPLVPLVAYALLTGAAFVVEGVVALVGAVVGHPGSSRGPSIVGGVLSVLAGGAVLVVPGVALGTFMVLAGIALVVVGVATLLLLPARAAARR